MDGDRPLNWPEAFALVSFMAMAVFVVTGPAILILFM